jgi:hypothetical protein
MFISSRISVLAFGNYVPMPPSTGRPAPVMKRASWGAKENGGIGHVTDLAQPAKRCLLDDRGDGGTDVRC